MIANKLMFAHFPFPCLASTVFIRAPRGCSPHPTHANNMMARNTTHWTPPPPSFGCGNKVGVADFGVCFVIPLGIPSNLHGIYRDDILTGKSYILETFEISGSGTEINQNKIDKIDQLEKQIKNIETKLAGYC